MRWFAGLLLLAGCPDVATPEDAASDPHIAVSMLPFSDQQYFSEDLRPLVGGGMKPIARGSVASVTVTGAPWVDQARDVAATSTGPALGIVDTDRRSAGAATVHIRGDQIGTAALQIARASDPRVLVQEEIAVAEPTRLRLLPAGERPARAETRTAQPYVYPFASWKLFIGEQRAVTLALFDGAGRRVLDEGMSFAVIEGDVRVRAPPWLTRVTDMIVFDAPDPGTVVVRATLSSGATFDAAVEVVGRVDRIAVSDDDRSPPREVGWHSWTTVCFGAYAGETSRVLGATWTYAASENLEVSEGYVPNCASIYGRAPGLGFVTARAGGNALEVPVEVGPALR